MRQKMISESRFKRALAEEGEFSSKKNKLLTFPLKKKSYFENLHNK